MRVEAEAVLQRPIDQDIAEPIDQPRDEAAPARVEDLLAPLARVADEIMEHAALERARILHAHHRQRQQVLVDARRREGIGRADLAAVLDHGLRAFRAIHAEARDIGLRIGEDMIADPGERQIGDDLFVLGQLVEHDCRCAPRSRPLS